MVLDELSKKYKIDISKEKHKALIGAGAIEGEKILLVKPQTFMNLSGESVQEIMNFYKEDIKNLIVIFDDIDLPIGVIRIKQNGSAGTHNGVKSIVKELSSKEFKRIKVGIGGPNEKVDLIGHVLGKFSSEEIPKIDESIPITIYRSKNIPNISYCSVVFPSARNFEVYLTIALPSPKSKTVRYAITEATREYKPYSLCPIIRNMYGVYSNATSIFNRITT
jgi:PTH1 family peptidyl-tRNA hydrolase